MRKIGTTRHLATAIAATVAALGTSLLLSAPAHAGIIVPQVHQDGVIIPQVRQTGIIVPQVHREGVIVPQVRQAGVIMDDVAGFPPGPTVGLSV